MFFALLNTCYPVAVASIVRGRSIVVMNRGNLAVVLANYNSEWFPSFATIFRDRMTVPPNQR